MADTAAVWPAPEGGRGVAQREGLGRRGLSRAASATRIAPGHSIDICGVRKKLAAFDSLSMQRVLSAAEDVGQTVQKYGGVVDEKYFGSGEVFGRYEAAQMRKDWAESDRLFLDALVKDRARYRRIIDSEETMYAFSAWLCGTALGSDRAYRWIDPPELESYTSGTFESRIEEDRTRRGFKALTANPELWFEGRKIKIHVPIGDIIHTSIRCVQYTTLPRRMRESDERIGDPKEAVHAAESEIRVPDGTPIPPGTEFVVMEDAGIDRVVTKELRRRYKVTGPGA